MKPLYALLIPLSLSSCLLAGAAVPAGYKGQPYQEPQAIPAASSALFMTGAEKASPFTIPTPSIMAAAS